MKSILKRPARYALLGIAGGEIITYFLKRLNGSGQKNLGAKTKSHAAQTKKLGQVGKGGLNEVYWPRSRLN